MADGSSKRFIVHPRSQFIDKFPYFREPRKIGVFSTDAKRQFHDSDRSLRHFVKPDTDNYLCYDLSKGFGTAILRDDSVNEYLHDLLKWILLHRNAFQISSKNSQQTSIKSLSTDFVCWRGLLTKLLKTPYENRDGWKIAVIRHGDTLYMCEYATDQKIQERARQTEREKEMSYWGYKFEQYVTADSPSGKPETSVAVNNNEAFVMVVRSRLKNHSLVYGGEVDCCEQSKSGTSYVELKTSRDFSHPRQRENFKRFKLISWWAQSFLVGIPKVVCGFRDDSGVVQRLESLQTMEIPRMIKDIRDPWDPALCFNFLEKFLDFVKSVVQDDDYRTAYVFSWDVHKDVVVERYPPNSEFSFLPDWYILEKSPTSKSELVLNPDDQSKGTLTRAAPEDQHGIQHKRMRTS